MDLTLFLGQLKFDTHGLVAVVVQDVENDEVLTLAYANREAIERSVATGFAHVYRRSHEKVMMKGETSGHRQEVCEILIDCDGDALVMKVRQLGPEGTRGAGCHEGYRSCFFRRLQQDGTLTAFAERVFDPARVYGAH
jgi:phosphoribosyl-AMP cyclohydrolase